MAVPFARPGRPAQWNRAGRRSLHVRSLERRSISEFYLTGAVGDGISESELLERVASTLAEERIHPIQEKIYAGRERHEEIGRIRNDAFSKVGLDPDTPVTYVEGRPVSGSGVAGIQVWGVAGDVAVETTGAGPGRVWTANGCRMLYLPFVRGDDSSSREPTAQAERMFENAGAILRANGFSYRHVARTWIYLSRLLDWYDDFNRVRTARYSAEGFGLSAGCAPYPASTGIQGRSAGEECFLSLLAVDGDAGIRWIQRSPRQDRASAYGSSFSRGLAVDLGGRTTIHVSGTASIDAEGKTLHEGNAEAQVFETLLNVGALLEEQGARLESIVSGTLFCKTPDVYEAYRTVLRLLGIPAIPVVPVLADVCRPELLVELEAVAFV